MKRLLLTGVVVLLAAMIGVGRADAGHLRYSSISAQSIGGDSYTFSFNQGQLGCGTIGSPLTLLTLDYGDGVSETPTGVITASQCVGMYLWQFGPALVDHTYASAQHGQTVTTSSFSSCRVGVQNSPFNCTMRSEASFVVGTGDSTPSVSAPPVVYCKTAQPCTFAIPATDVDGDQLRWRMSTNAEMGGTANPADMAVASTTGVVTWDTTGKNDGLWAVDITVEELDLTGAPKGKTAADFIVALGNYDTPTFASPSPADASTLSATVGQPFSVDLKANAPSGKTAALSSLVLPGWLSCPFAPTADPATVTCTGTPTTIGSSQLVVLATASDGPQSTRSYRIDVTAAAPAPTTTTTTTTTPAPTPAPASAPEPAPAPAPIEVAPPAAPASGFVSGDTAGLKVANAGDEVLVATSSDLKDAVHATVAEDGTIKVDVPKGIEGKLTYYVVRPGDGSVAEVTLTVDTKAPDVLSVVHVSAPKKTAAADPPVDQPRKFFQVKGSDGGSGIVSMQVAPTAGKTWAWRSFVTKFSAPLKQKTVRVRIRDAAGNVSDWFVVPVTTAR
jgi:hypothetical protein